MRWGYDGSRWGESMISRWGEGMISRWTEVSPFQYGQLDPKNSILSINFNAQLILKGDHLTLDTSINNKLETSYTNMSFLEVSRVPCLHAFCVLADWSSMRENDGDDFRWHWRGSESEGAVIFHLCRLFIYFLLHETSTDLLLDNVAAAKIFHQTFHRVMRFCLIACSL